MSNKLLHLHGKMSGRYMCEVPTGFTPGYPISKPHSFWFLVFFFNRESCDIASTGLPGSYFPFFHGPHCL
jgi:hypothetical protein